MQQTQKEIIKYLKISYRHRYLFIAVALLVMTGVTVYSYMLPQKYEADSTVFIEENIINRLVEGIAMTPDITEQINVLQFALVSRDIVTKVLEDIGSDIFTKSKSEQQAFITELREKIEIRVKGRDLFTVALTHSDPSFAQNFVNTLVSKYVEESVRSKRDESYGANRFLEEQIELFKKKLDDAENAIIEFRKKQGVYLSLDEETDLIEIKEFMREIEDIGLELQTLEARRQSLAKQLDTLSPTVNIFSSEGGGRVAELEQRLRDLLLRYTENYPEVVRVKAELEGMKRMSSGGDKGEVEDPSRLSSINPLYQEVQQNIFEVEAEISSLEAKKKNLRNLISTRERSLHDVPVNKKELAVLIQERDSHREIYQELLTRMGQSEVSKQMEISDKASTFRIVDPADFPEIPVSPNMVIMILLAIVGGIGSGLGVAVLRDLLDASVNDPAQLEEIGVDVLVMIPNISDGIEEELSKKRDKLIYVAGSCYFSVFLLLLVYESLYRLG